MRKKFNIVLAAARNGTIGKESRLALRTDQLPWSLPGDLKFFKNITTKGVNPAANTETDTETGTNGKNVLVMGRKTWESMRKLSKNGKTPLPGRLIYVISANNNAKDLGVEDFPDDAEAFSSLEEAFESADEDHRVKEVFVVGGAGIISGADQYRAGHCKNLFLTRVGQNVDGDVKVNLSDLTKGLKLTEISKTLSDKGLNYDFTRWINPKLFGELYNTDYARPYFAEQHEELQYLELVRKIIDTGSLKTDRTGVGTFSLFGTSMRYDLERSFPLLTTKKVFWKGVVEELLWFLKGSTDGKLLSDKGVKIWDGNGSREFLDNLGFKHRRVGDLGPVYGFQWRHFGANYVNCDTNYQGQGVDQIQQVIDMIKKSPDSRRLIVNAWNVKDLPQMALPPCHVLFQFYVDKGRLSCLLYQRSCDIGLGIPFNIASYALLTCLVAKVASSQLTQDDKPPTG